MTKLLGNILKTALPFALGIGILWWMYRETDWTDFWHTISSELHWGWMLVSLIFGVVPQVFRALRWQMTLRPMGEFARSRTCINAIFLSYAASLVIPRVGEVTRCGTLKKVDDISFSKSIGTVVTERLVDSLIMLVIAAAAFLSQLPVFLKFIDETGADFHSLVHRFSSTGYLVTILCIVLALAICGSLLFRYKMFAQSREKVLGIWEGIRSLRHVERPWLYWFYSVGIWVGYFLHFYLAFFCFDFTAGINPWAALLIFSIGSFAVLVPTPNGAGSWHFAVKTMLVLYGVAEAPAVMFALVVHTIQTGLVILLGAWGWADLTRIEMIKPASEKCKNA
ncbi:MAG: lysylphosphatidylglycerol synthase transmembrane domain-containing protein [Prevotellamassilia sp.]|nr:lysylphosphatidylglycerol synthase transmembrane domain-containing protein [Prevotellamassilia sp.]